MQKDSGTAAGYYFATMEIPTRANGRMISEMVSVLPDTVLGMSTMDSGSAAEGTAMASCTSRRVIRTSVVGRMA